ncbi:hypothetical protein EIP91_000054 [Steccherinum ochraceum]|uniref:F-box domain-containing protein n=1 Tax=Steccherinum ochraceum TaxID=92696 RepID=A0A4R0RX42_9APHY|nr:hypothetical protein EIP91_000054 [Steccherinum ochraceum]
MVQSHDHFPAASSPSLNIRSGTLNDTLFHDHTAFANIRNRPASWIRAEVAQTLQHLSALYSVVNAEAPVCRLPPEILSQVFLWVVALTSPKTNWVRITHVCRQWRDVALDCQTLWTHITPQHPEPFVSICLQRAGAAPLQVQYHHDASRGCKHSQEFMQTIGPHAPRFGDLDIAAPPSVMRKMVEKLGGPLPYLKRLALVAKTPGLNLTSPFLLPEDFTSGIPSLHQLSLTCATVSSWNLPLFSGIRTLHLSEQHRSFAPSIDQFLDVLERCPALEELSLRNAGPTLGGDATSYPEPTRKVELGSLRLLSLSQDRFYDIPFVLAHVAVPQTTRLEIQYLGQSHHPHHALGSSFKYCLPRDTSSLLPLKAVSYLRLGAQGGFIQAVGLSEGDGVEDCPLICISTKWPQSFQSPDEWIYDAFRQLPLAFSQCPVHHLALIFPARLAKAEDWTQLFSAFPTIKTLTVEQSRAGGPFDKHDAAKFLFGALGETSMGRLPAPHLSSLRLQSWTGADKMEQEARACLLARARHETCVPLDLTVNCELWSVDGLMSVV